MNLINKNKIILTYDEFKLKNINFYIKY